MDYANGIQSKSLISTDFLFDLKFFKYNITVDTIINCFYGFDYRENSFSEFTFFSSIVVRVENNFQSCCFQGWDLELNKNYEHNYNGSVIPNGLFIDAPDSLNALVDSIVVLPGVGIDSFKYNQQPFVLSYTNIP